MKLADVAARLKAEGYLDEREIFGYGQLGSSSFGGAIGGGIAAASNLILISVNGELLSVFHSKVNNDYKDLVFSVPFSQVTDLSVKGGFLGLQKKVKFKVGGVGKSILLPFGQKKLIEFFKNFAAAK